MGEPHHAGPRRNFLLGFAALTGGGMSAAAVQVSQKPAVSPAAQGAVDPRAYGARLDGSTDDSAALRAASELRRPILIAGTLRIDQVVDLPPDTVLLGNGVYRSTLMLGPAGKLRMAGAGFGRCAGGGVMRDLTVAPVSRAGTGVGVELRHAEHFLFDNVTFYRLNLVLDDHHYLSFRDCRFFGDENLATLVSNCAAQPSGEAAISESMAFTRCFFSSFPVILEDTVDARFTDCTFFSGAFGVRSRRRLARGSDAEPFFMGPTLSGCVLDSINGPAIDIEGGGTDCRLVNNFISAGRVGKAPGVRLAASSGVELIGNRLEWCGSAGLVMEDCEKIGLTANSFANMAAGPGVSARRSREVRIVGNVFENRPRWGGSGAGGTTLALQCDSSCENWVATGNTASGLCDTRVSTLGSSIVQANPGWPASTEQGWPMGPSAARPRGVEDGYRWYDQTLGLWLHWHQASGRWRDGSGRAV